MRFLFPSSIAVYGLPSLEEKHRAGRLREEQWNVPITMYGCNKLYCEHLGRYFTFHARQLGALSGAARLDFRVAALPGPHLGRHGAHRRHERLRPGDDPRRRQGRPLQVLRRARGAHPVHGHARRRARDDGARRAPSGRASRRASTTSPPSARAPSEIAERVRRAFPEARIDYEPDPVRAKIVASWPEDVDDARARRDWGWKPAYDWERAFDEYLVPEREGTLRAGIGRTGSAS